MEALLHLQTTNLKASTKRPYRLFIYHTEKRSRRATPEIFLFMVSCEDGKGVEPHLPVREDRVGKRKSTLN